MTPAIRLTERERAEVRKRSTEDLRSDFLFVMEALSEMDEYTGTLWHNAFKARDYYFMGEMMERAIREYAVRSGELTKAEDEEERLKSIEHGG